MKTSDPSGFANLVPGFDFLQGLMKSAGASVPNIGQWVAPTLDPAELEKRIGELRTVQFWLEQNARLLGTTIQALEVQRMTLSTLKTMNVQMGDLRESLKVRVPTGGFGAAAADAPTKPTSDDAETAAAPGMVDPMQWWGALTKQFTQLAAGAVPADGADNAKTLAAHTLQQSFETAGDAFRKILPPGFGGLPAPLAKAVARKTARRAAAKRAAPKKSPAGR